MDARKKILIDTDIGDDIDDAFALLTAMALSFDIVGITTVFRDTRKRAGMAKKLLKAFGKGYESVPVYAGLSTYTEEKEENSAHMCCFSRDLDDPEYAPENQHPEEAVDFIIDSCRRYGKDLAVIAIGPFCNIARVIEKDPAALELAGKVVIMGGAYFKQYADWNVMCDVPAADLMFRSLSNLECIGADVTHKLLSQEDFTAALSAPEHCGKALSYICSLYRDWRALYPKQPLVLHDALVVYYLYDPSICTMQEIHTAVVCDGYAKGLTLNIDAYSKAWLNDAYKEQDLFHSVLAAADIDLPKFHSFLRRDLSSCKLPDCDS